MNEEQKLLLAKSLKEAYIAGKGQGFVQATILYALMATAMYLITLL